MLRASVVHVYRVCGHVGWRRVEFITTFASIGAAQLKNSGSVGNYFGAGGFKGFAGLLDVL